MSTNWHPCSKKLAEYHRGESVVGSPMPLNPLNVVNNLSFFNGLPDVGHLCVRGWQFLLVLLSEVENRSAK